MSSISLDRLKRLPPRRVWQNEATEFTPWLARDENFAALAEELHFADAEVETTEKSIGSFSADIIARDRDGYILVENQLEQTDHNHLGQIMTYLAGLDGPVKVVWVSTKVREEHRAAVDWLNTHTANDFAFFAVELELFQIGESPAAPHFYVVAKPNEWSRHVNQQARELTQTALSDRQKQYREFWGAFGDFLSEHDPSYTQRTPSKDYWWTFGIGRSGFLMNMYVGIYYDRISASLTCTMDPDKLGFDHFHSQREELEAELGSSMDWKRGEDTKQWEILFHLHNVDPMDQERWPEYFAWYWDKMQRLRQVFTARVRALDFEELRHLSQYSGSEALEAE